MKNDFNLIFKALVKLLNPLPPVGGLLFSDASVKFLMIAEDRRILTSSFRLTPGIIDGGKVKDAPALIAVLKKLHVEFAPFEKSIHVVVNLPPQAAYTQYFTLPHLSEERLPEAVDLNLKMISPLGVHDSYHGWQQVGESLSQGGQLELLGAFSESSIVNEFSRVVTEAHFNIVAIEFPSLAITRLVSRQPGFDAAEPYLLIDISNEGTALMIMRNLNLFFNHFHSWQAIQDEYGGKKITQEDFKRFIVKEIKKLVNFYSSRWGSAIHEAVLVTSQLNVEITNAIETEFAIKVINLAVPDFPNITSAWFTVLGSAMRGLIPRSEDGGITLTSSSVQIQYWHDMVLNFIGLWRKIILSVMVFASVIFLGLDFFLMSAAGKLDQRLVSDVRPNEVLESEKLQASAAEFNRSLDLVLYAKENSFDLSPIIAELQSLAGSEILVKNIIFGTNGLALSGMAANETSFLKFRSRVERIASLESVNFPITNIKNNLDGSVDFSVNAKLKQL